MSNNIATRGAIASFLFVLSYLYNCIGTMVIVLAFAMALDYITGLAAAYTLKEINSKTGIIGIIKKVCYIILLFMAFLFDLAIGYLLDDLGIQMPIREIFGVMTTCWLFANEGISIFENLIKLGVPVPEFLQKGFKHLKQSIDDKANKGGC